MRTAHVKRVRLIIPSAFLLVLACAVTAGASPVTVTGGFTSFTGVTSGTAAGCDPNVQAFVAGTLVNAPACTGSGISGPASLTFGSTLGSVEFFETLSGTPSTGQPPHNTLSFTPWPVAQDVQVGDEFNLGTLSMTNGTWFGGPPATPTNPLGIDLENSFHLELTTVSSDSLLSGHTLSDDIVWGISPNMTSRTAEQNADPIFLSNFTSLGVLWAYEAGTPGHPNTSSVVIVGRIGSLIPTSFMDVSGGFVTSTLDPTPSAAVPEPMTLVLVGSGLASAWIRRRRT